MERNPSLVQLAQKNRDAALEKLLSLSVNTPNVDPDKLRADLQEAARL